MSAILRHARNILAITVVLAGVFFSIPVERPDDGISAFDTQVVLGGNMTERVNISHNLWLEHPTPILVTGDNRESLEALQKLGVPLAQLHHEAKARSTWENARFSIPILRSQGDKTVVIVTSNVHAARAYACFAKQAPEIRFLTRTSPVAKREWNDQFQVVVIERLKILAYALWHGINPWGGGQ